jgi:GNAT superfamily N-acetyltransferase
MTVAALVVAILALIVSVLAYWRQDKWAKVAAHAQAQLVAIEEARDTADQLVGIGVVVPHLRPRIAQLAFLHVSAPLRATGIGSRLSEQLEQIARTAGDSDMVVSATPSENTARFYLGRGFQPMAEPLAELFELEPEDVHMRKVL